jgi:hypothetical protein
MGPLSVTPLLIWQINLRSENHPSRCLFLTSILGVVSKENTDIIAPGYTRGRCEDTKVQLNLASSAQAPPMILDYISVAAINEPSPWLAYLLTLCLAWLPAPSWMLIGRPFLGVSSPTSEFAHRPTVISPQT